MNVGLVGIGFMGMMHYLAYQKVKGAKVVAIAARDEKKLAGDWRGIQGNFGPPGTQMDLGKIARYRDWRELLKDPKVDVVDICLPSSLHAEAAIAVLKAGKHAIVEKPIALQAADAERMVKAAKAADRQLLIAQVLPFFPEYAFVRQAVEKNKYGKLLGGNFKRVIADPLWMKDFHDPNGGGGPVVDLHIHDAHFIRLICGMPKTVYATGRSVDGNVRFVNVQFTFDDPSIAVTAQSGVIEQQGRSFTHGFEIYFEKATLLFDLGVFEGKPNVSMPLTVLTRAGKVERPKLTEVDGFVAELTEAAKSLKSGRVSPLLSGEIAGDALRLCQREVESMRTGKIVRV